jgi:hypothetical protein
VSYELRVHPDVAQDLRSLANQDHVDPDWRLRPDEVEPAVRKALELIRSLGDDPRQGLIMSGRANTTVTAGMRRLKFDPRDPPPGDRRGRPRPRLRLVWRNLPDESAVEIVSVLAVGHRQNSRPYRDAAARNRDQA